MERRQRLAKWCHPCTLCGRQITKGRLEALPGITVCANCSHVNPRTEANVDIAEADQEDLIHASQNEGEQK